jgi:colicin import membrane protein
VESLTLSPRKMSREDVWTGVSGSVLVHVLIFALAIVGPFTSSSKIHVSPAWTVGLVSMQDLGLGSETSPKATAPKGAAAAKSQEGQKGTSSDRGKSGPLVPVKRLQLNEPSGKADTEIKKLETPEVPKFASNSQSAAAVEKNLDKLITKPKPAERPSSAPVARDSGEKGGAASPNPPQKAVQSASEGSQGSEKGAAGARDGAGKAGEKSVQSGAQSGGAPGGADGAQVGLARRLYYTEIWNAIRRQWVLPEYLKSQRLETMLVVVVRRDGKVLDLRVEKSSGNEAYDESARRAVRKAEPLPPFPAIYSPAQEEIGLRFRPEDLS